MNKEQLFSIIRSIVIGVATYAAGKGWVGQDVALQIGTVLLAVLAAVWGVTAKTDAGLVAQASAIVPVSVASQKAVGITSVNLDPKISSASIAAKV